MSAIVEVPEDLIPHLREGARLSHLSEEDFVVLALAQSLARVLNNPALQLRAERATGRGWKEFLDGAGDEVPKAGDEIIKRK